MCTMTPGRSGSLWLHDVLRKSRLASDAVLAPTSEVQVQRDMIFDVCLCRQDRSPGHSRRPHLAVRHGRAMNFTDWFLNFIIITSSIFQFATKNCCSCLSNFSVYA